MMGSSALSSFKRASTGFQAAWFFRGFSMRAVCALRAIWGVRAMASNASCALA